MIWTSLSSESSWNRASYRRRYSNKRSASRAIFFLAPDRITFIALLSIKAVHWRQDQHLAFFARDLLCHHINDSGEPLRIQGNVRSGSLAVSL
jgi:hypothetical protein